MIKIHILAVAASLAAIVSPAHADCLEDATKFAVNLCGDIERSGIKETASGNLQGSASVSAIIKKFIDASGKGDVQGSVERYEGVAREELAKDRFDTRSCRQNMAKAAIDVQCQKKVTFNTCARPEFGLDRWDSETTQDGNSGWMGGGHSQGEWCGALAGQVIAQHQVGPEHKATTISSSEDSHKDWKGHVEYNYSCRVQVQWNPIFKSQPDPLCGIAAVN